MKCQKCGGNAASVHLTKIINGVKQESYLCESCANEKSYYAPGEWDFGVDINSFLSGMLGSAPSAPKGALACPACGLTFSEFAEAGRLGCPQCYEAFRARLMGPLRQIHGADTHVGKIPSHCSGKIRRDRRLRELNDELNRAVALQEYEKAARFRDEINELKGQN